MDSLLIASVSVAIVVLGCFRPSSGTSELVIGMCKLSMSVSIPTTRAVGSTFSRDGIGILATDNLVASYANSRARTLEDVATGGRVVRSR
jgi:hypothetical protein